MRIAVLGTGMVGRAVAGRLAECVRPLREEKLQVALDAVLLERRRLAHVVRHVAQHLEQSDFEPVFIRARAFPDDQRVSVLLDRGRRGHPVQRLVAAGVGVDEDRAVGLEHEQARRLGKNGGEPPGVPHLAAGNDQTHAGTVLAVSDVSTVDSGDVLIVRNVR